MLGDTLVGSRKIIHTSFFAGQKTSAYLRSHEHTNKDFPIARIESVAFVCWWPTTGKICSFPRGPIGFCPNGFFAVVSHPSEFPGDYIVPCSAYSVSEWWDKGPSGAVVGLSVGIATSWANVVENSKTMAAQTL